MVISSFLDRFQHTYIKKCSLVVQGFGIHVSTARRNLQRITRDDCIHKFVPCGYNSSFPLLLSSDRRKIHISNISLFVTTMNLIHKNNIMGKNNKRKTFNCALILRFHYILFVEGITDSSKGFVFRYN